MIPVVHPRLLDVARVVRLSQVAEKTASEEKPSMDADILSFANDLVPGEKQAVAWPNLGASLYNFARTKQASLSILQDGVKKLAAAGVVEEALDTMDTDDEGAKKLAAQVRDLNHKYATAVLYDMLDRER